MGLKKVIRVNFCNISSKHFLQHESKLHAQVNWMFLRPQVYLLQVKRQERGWSIKFEKMGVL